MRASTVLSIFLKNKALRFAAAFVLWIGVWALASFAVGKGLILPSPLPVAAALVSLAAKAGFWLAAGASLLRIACGFAAGVVLGTALAAATSASAVADVLLSPAIRVVRATPVASFIILVLLWTTRAMVPGVISALMVIPVVWGQVSSAIRETDRDLLEMAAAYRFGGVKTLRLIYIPSVLPQFASACLTSQGLAWKSGVAAEVLCLPRTSIGTQLYYSKLYIDTDGLFAWTVTVIILSLVLEKLCKLIFFRFSKREGGK